MTSATQPAPDRLPRLREGLIHLGDVPVLAGEAWAHAFPWLVHGVTTRGAVEESDFRLWAGAHPRALDRWDSLREASASTSVVTARQVHGATVRVHGAVGPGLHLVPACDGHLTREEGLLLAVTLADCVPVFLVAPEPRIVGLLHAGWRGTADGILHQGVAAFQDHFGVTPGELHLHLGPAIGEESYEVGPEVHEALGLPVPPAPRSVDLRGVLAGQALAAGLRGEAVTRSSRDTLTDPLLFSHRGGDRGRHVAFLGVADAGGVSR